MIIKINEKPRVCGECNLCCRVLGIKDEQLQKPKDQWCDFALKKCGCSIYHGRPQICRDFECLWLRGQFGGPEFRPDKIHGVVTPTTDGKNWVIHEDHGYPGVARTALKGIIKAWVAQKQTNYVIVTCGSKRAYFGHPETFAKLQGTVDELTGMDNVKVIRTLGGQ